MMEKNQFNESGLSNFEAVVKAANGFLKTKIISSELDQAGIVLYNWDKTQNSLNFDGVYVLEKLDIPNAETIKSLETLIDSKKIRFGHSDQEIPLFEALWIWQQQFKSLDINQYGKRIFLFTDEEDPMSESQSDRDTTYERVKNLRDDEIEIELFPMPHPVIDKPDFDIKKFYHQSKENNIISLNDEDMNDMMDYEMAYSRLQDLSKRIRLKEFRKRVLGKWLFSVTSKMRVGLKFFNLTKTTKKPNAHFVNKNTNKELKSLTRLVCKETGESLYRNQIGTHFPVKDKKVIITENDMKKIKHFDHPGMKLLGFKSRASIKAFHNIRPSYFIYPDEIIMKGSSQTFHAMIKSLIKKDKVAMVRFVAREGAMVRFWALLPQDENQNNEQFGGHYTPPGFHCIFLPYAEDIRDIEEYLSHKEKLPQAEKDEVRTAKLFIRNMGIDFDSRNFENPSIQQFYSGLQSFALNEQPEDIQDTLEPDYEGMKRMQPVVDKMKDAFFGGAKEDAVSKVNVPKTD